jgi:5'-nucleotidase
VELSTHNAALEENEGWLVRTSGEVVTKTNDYNLFVDDGSGPARVFIDGYNGDFTGIQVGDEAHVVGLASEDGDGQRIRVRNPDHVVTWPAGEFPLTILHTNDVHGHVDEEAPRLATVAQGLQATRPNALLLDAGDQFMGTLFYKLYKAHIITITMNALGYDAMAVGNHEFDDGPGELARLIDGADFPVLSANIDASAEPTLAGKIKASTVITLSGEPVGIVGLTTPETAILSSPGPNVVFSDPVTSLQAEVDLLTAQGIDKIIALTHLGYLHDIDLAQAVSGVDVIVGGHSHTFLYTPPDGLAGPYPTVVDDLDGNPVLIVSAEDWAKYLGHLDVTFSPTGTVSSYAGNPIELDDSVAMDPAIDALIEPYRAGVEVLKSTYVGTTTVDLLISVGGVRICRAGECLMGNLVADAIRWDIESTTGEDYIAIQNGGGLRDDIYAGPVSVGDVLQVLPFGNTMATFELTGTHVISALENGVSQVEFGAGRFPQVSGLRYTFDPDAPAFSRILAVEVLNGSTYVPIDENAIYKIATNDYMRGGGDGYSVFEDYAIDPYDEGPPLDEVVIDYFATFSPVTPVLEGRIARASTISATAGATLVYTDAQGNATVVQAPVGASTEAVQLVMMPLMAVTPPSGFLFANHAFDLIAYQGGVPVPGFVFAKPVTITINYSDADVAMMDENTLVLEYWDGGAWVDAACGPYDRHPADNWLAVPICHLTQFGLFASAPSLSVFKSVMPAADVPLGGVVNYTIVLSNSGDGPAIGVVMTDVLPSEVDFGGWVEQGSAMLAPPDNDVITWGPWSVPANDSYTIRFTATVTTSTAYYAAEVTNPVEFSSANAGSGSASAVFTVVQAPPSFSVLKSVMPAADVPLGGVVNYTIVLSNSGDGAAMGVVMTDVLPSEVDFGGWVEQGSAMLAPPDNDVITWGPWSVPANDSYTIRFTATVTTGVAYYGAEVTNPVEFSSTNAGSGSASAVFTIEGGHIYLPLIMKDAS